MHRGPTRPQVAVLPQSRAKYEAYNGSNPNFSTAIKLPNGTSDPTLAAQDVTLRFPKAPKVATNHAGTGLGAKWQLLTGPRQAIYALARKSYFAEKSLGLRKGSGEFLHTENVMLVDGQGRLRGVYNATLPADIGRAMADITVLLRERYTESP